MANRWIDLFWNDIFLIKVAKDQNKIWTFENKRLKAFNHIVNMW